VDEFQGQVIYFGDDDSDGSRQTERKERSISAASSATKKGDRQEKKVTYKERGERTIKK